MGPVLAGVVRVTRNWLSTSKSSVTARRGMPWLTSCPHSRPTRSTSPYKASVIASSSDDFPAPVGPVIAKTSRSRKSISCSSRKLVNPLSLSLSGRISVPPARAREPR